MFRREPALEFLLVHPGGPFWKNKDQHAWSIPKGELSEDEDPLQAAIREFKEETGFDIQGDFLVLPAIKQKSGKWIYAWAVEANLDETAISGNLFSLEWPPRSGKVLEFPEVDRAGWFNVEEAKEKLNEAQYGLIGSLIELLKIQPG